jgi:hypothetical protein
MSPTLEYAKITDARIAISDIYDTVSRHLVVGIARENDAPVTVIRKDDLKSVLLSHCALEPKVHFSKAGQVSIWLENLPVSSQGNSLIEAEIELIESLRAYTQTWIEELREYPNHHKGWALPALVQLSDDNELRQFLFGNEE